MPDAAITDIHNSFRMCLPFHPGLMPFQDKEKVIHLAISQKYQIKYVAHSNCSVKLPDPSFQVKDKGYVLSSWQELLLLIFKYPVIWEKMRESIFWENICGEDVPTRTFFIRLENAFQNPPSLGATFFPSGDTLCSHRTVWNIPTL